jgi:hypothetical protein
MVSPSDPTLILRRGIGRMFRGWIAGGIETQSAINTSDCTSDRRRWEVWEVGTAIREERWAIDEVEGLFERNEEARNSWRRECVMDQ